MSASGPTNNLPPTPQDSAADKGNASKQPPLRGGSRLAGSISISMSNIPKVEVPKIVAEVKPLVQEDLERYWKEAGEELGIANLLKDATVRLGERTGCIEVDAQTTYFHEEFKSHRTAVLETLRSKSGMKMLECKVNQLFVGKDEVIYSPEEKYKTMLEANPQLQGLRKLFPNVDF